MAKVKLKNIKIDISFTKADSKIIFRLLLLLLLLLFAKKRCQYLYTTIWSQKEALFTHTKFYQEESTILHKNIPWVKLYQYSQKYLYPKLNGYGNNREVSVKDLKLLGVY